MFRNVIGVQEAIIHKQSEESLNSDKIIIKDVHSDVLAQQYSTLKHHWIHKRQQLKDLQKHEKHSEEIQRIEHLIQCLDELIERGQITKKCQLLIDEMNQHIHSITERYFLRKKTFNDRQIRLPRHISKTQMNSFRKIPSEIFHLQSSINSEDKEIDNRTETESFSNENRQNAVQFYVIAEQFQTKQSTRN